MSDKIILNKDNIVPLLEEAKKKLELNKQEFEANPIVFYKGKYIRLGDVRMTLDE